MTSRPIKMAVVFLLGFALAWQGVFAVSASAGANVSVAKRSCCCAGCDNKHCATPSCCVKPEAPSTPVAPVSLPTLPQNEFQALAASFVSLLLLPVPPAHELSVGSTSSSSVRAIPLFQRDCAYLI